LGIMAWIRGWCDWGLQLLHLCELAGDAAGGGASAVGGAAAAVGAIPAVAGGAALLLPRAE
jgi:hypothetical protein